MLTFCRMTKDKKKLFVMSFNFSPVAYENFQSGVLCPEPIQRSLTAIFAEYGGTGLVNRNRLKL